MARKFLKDIQFMTLLSLLLLVSCKDVAEFSGALPANSGNTTSSTPFTKTWDFSTSGDYSFDSNYVNVSGSSADLKTIDLVTDSSAEWNAGTLSDVSVSGNSLVLNTTATSYPEFDASWTPKWSSLISYYKFEEASWNGTAGEVIDSKGTHHGTAYGDANTTTTHKIGTRAANFDGAGDYIRIDSLKDSFNNGDNFSLSLWFKSSKASGQAYQNALFSAHTSTGGNELIVSMGTSLGSFYLRLYSVFNNNVSSGFNGDTWHHLVLTQNTATDVTKIYVDKVSIGSFTHLDLRWDSMGRVSIGQEWDSSTASSDFFLGQIDDVAIWKDVLTTSDIDTIYHRQNIKYGGTFKSAIQDIGTSSSWPALYWETPLPFGKDLPLTSELSADYVNLSGNNLMTNLVALYHMNESSWGTVIDATGSYNGTRNGNAKPTFHGVLGSAGGSFDGNGDYIVINNVKNAFSNNTSFTLSTWFKTNKKIADNWRNIIFSAHHTNKVTSVFRIGVAANGGIYFTNSTSGYVRGSGYDDSNWHHLVFVIDEATDTITAYVDGVFLSNTFGHETMNWDTAGFVSIAQEWDGSSPSDFFQGHLDELAVWSRPLSATEALELYRRGANQASFQVRSCANADCSDQDALSDDGWIGPDGSSSTFFSEFHNNAIINGSGSPTGNVQTTLPYLSFSDFVTAPTNNRYFQWQTRLLGINANTSCAGSTSCMPELTKVSLLARTGSTASGTEIPRYSGFGHSIQNATSQSFSSLTSVSISEAGDCSSGTPAIGYRLSNDGGTSWLYYNSGWVSSSSDSQVSTKAQLESNIATFPLGNGELKFRALLNSDTTKSCSISSITLNGKS